MMISFLRTALLYVVIIIAVRLMGKRQISELQTSELVVTLLISDIAAIPMQDSGQPLVSGLLPIGILIVCEILASIWMLKSTKFRRAICGRPIVVINNGRIDQQEMRRLRMSTEDLIEAVVVSDGVISDFSLVLIHKSKAWVEGILKGKSTQLNEVFIMTANTKGDFQIIKKEDAKTT